MSPSIVRPVPAPTHPHSILVERGEEGAFASRAISLKDMPAGEVFEKMSDATKVDKCSYTTVQTSKSGQIELNSDLVFCNHSCDPSLVFDMNKMEVRVIGNRDLKAGQDLTFFYPSSEWDMAQPFDCNCGASDCVGTIKGARYLDDKTLSKYWLNQHIKDLLAAEGRKA